MPGQVGPINYDKQLLLLKRCCPGLQDVFQWNQKRKYKPSGMPQTMFKTGDMYSSVPPRTSIVQQAFR